MFGWDLTNNALGFDPSLVETVDTGTVRCYVTFNKALKTSIAILILSEFPCTMQIKFNRDISLTSNESS